MFGSLMRLEHEVWVEEVRAAAGHSVRPPDGLRMGWPQKSRTSAAQVWAASADHHGAQTWAPWWSAEGFIKATSVCCDRLNCTYRGLFSFKGARSHPDPACYRGDAKGPPQTTTGAFNRQRFRALQTLATRSAPRKQEEAEWWSGLLPTPAPGKVCRRVSIFRCVLKGGRGGGG